MTSRQPTIRRARPEDQEALSNLIAAAYATLGSGYDDAALRAALPAMSRANPRLLAGGTYYVAEIDGAPAGCGGWTMEKPGTGEIVDGEAHIRHFATHPAYLRRGVAKLLLDHCLAEAAVAGARLMKSQSTLPAEKFYAAAGFRRVGQDRAIMAPGIVLPVGLMERPLP